MKSKNSASGKNLSLALFFIAFILAVIITSFLWKAIIFLSQSKFDGKHQFIVAVQDQNSEHIISFEPDTQTINVLNFSGVTDKNSFLQSTEIPANVVIAAPFESDITQLVRHQILHDISATNWTIIDKIKLWWFARSLPDGSVTQTDVQMPISQEIADKTIPKLLTDRTLYQESKSIVIINAAGENGLGGRLSKLLTNIGANVIMVDSQDQLQDKTTITYVGDSSYTLSRLQNILHVVPTQLTQKSSISDITVIIGKDKANPTEF